jgi:biopolymer transport protein ExbB
MMFFILKGGPVMWPILVASVFGFAIVLERFIVIRRAFRIDMEAFSKSVCNKVLAGKTSEAMALAQRHTQHPLGAMFVATLENSDLPREELEKMLERMGNHAVNKLETRLGALVSITGIEPLLGFLGTITGLIRAFMAWETAGNDITVSDLAGGIYEAMITTAAGLMIAIPLYLAYNYFISRNKYFAQELTDYSGQLLEAIARGRLL